MWPHSEVNNLGLLLYIDMMYWNVCPRWTIAGAETFQLRPSHGVI